MQLLWTSFTYLLKNVEHGTKHVVNGAREVCIHYTFLNFTADFMNTFQFKQMMNLTV